MVEPLPPIDTAGTITLVVARNTGTSLDLTKVPIAGAVVDAFRDVIEDATNELATRTPEPWSAEAVVEAETYLITSVDSAGTGPKLSRKAQKRGDSLIAVLRNAAALDVLGARKLSPFPLYAFVVGDDPSDRAVFIRRSNPRRGLGSGRIFTTLGETLVRVDEPIFGFDDEVDLVVAGDQMAIFSTASFRAIFRDNEQLRAQVPAWIEEIASHVPIAGDGALLLAEASNRDSRVRRRLETIRDRGHLATLDKKKLRDSLKRHGLDAGLLSKNGELVIDEKTDVFRLFQVLNEDRYFGDLSGDPFRADRKSPG